MTPKSTNFSFLIPRFPEVGEAAREAEQQVYTKAVTSGMYARQAMELLVNWVYANDPEYEWPYQNTLAAKLRTDIFQQDTPPPLLRGLEFIRKVGNRATHTRKINSREALAAVEHLFNYCRFIVRTYTEDKWPETFQEDYIPQEDPMEVMLREIGYLREAMEKQQRELAEQRERLVQQPARQQELEEQGKELVTQKQRKKHLPLPASPVSESETRRLFIDVMLKEADWDLEAANVREFKLDNMPRRINPSGRGAVDYVLWGSDGLPLAVVEAKKTTKDASAGQQQAVVYADCLEERYGRRPVIFYTNGYRTWLWEDQFYPPREIQGFYNQDELQLMVDRRQSRQDLRQLLPNAQIAGRYYQVEAIRRVAEAYVTDGEHGLTGNRRKALLVMATGTGKTRTAIALVDLLLRAQWVKRVLFLADRNALVTQAKRNFNTHLPELTAIDLTKEREDTTTRLVFSTYPTIMNRIDDARNPDGNTYGVGHFDLIIVDEAHRSIYKKYEDIFRYFDGLVLGLTATPRDETHRDTYQAFDCEQGNPTFYYELDQAVQDGFLVPPKKVILPTKFLQRGIQYSELSEADQEAYEQTFALLGQDPPDEITPEAINQWLFNKDTVIKILDAVMNHGRKIASGDKLGKTIIFAKRQEHARFIKEVFDEQYPQYAGHFAQTISYQDGKFAEDLIDRFKTPDSHPQLAISVDMLETGIDVPEIVNLVLFRPVYSKAKFWQMIGRGTRLCEDLYGPGQDKEDFFVFDCCGNFEFFDINPQGISGTVSKSVSQRIFELRIQLAQALSEPAFLDDDAAQTYRNALLDLSHQSVGEVYERRHQFRIKMRLALIDPFTQRTRWDQLRTSDLTTLFDEIGPLVHIQEEDEKAKLFDALLYKVQLARTQGDPAYETGRQVIVERAQRLHQKANVPVVREQLSLIQRVQQAAFWEHASLAQLEEIRQGLRHLQRLLLSKGVDPVYTNFEDELVAVAPATVDLPSAPANYLARVETFVRDHQDYLVIRKLHRNEPITAAELQQLEDLLFDGEIRGTREDFVQALGNAQPLGLFIRSILGLDRQAAMEAFAQFLQRSPLSADQQQFIHQIIDHFSFEGIIDPRQLYEPPYTDLHLEGPDGLFNDDDCSMIISIIRKVNENAVG